MNKGNFRVIERRPTDTSTRWTDAAVLILVLIAILLTGAVGAAAITIAMGWA